MSVEITVSLRVTASLSFDMEPGDVLTTDVISDYVDTLQRYLDNAPVDAGSCQLYAVIAGTEAAAPIDAYNRETGATFNVALNQPVGEA